jgi:O-antigen/teichoic acid export membrane protein
MDKLLMLVIGAGLIYTPYFQPLTIQWFVIGQTLAYVLTASLAGGFCWYYYHKKPTTNENSSTNDISIKRLFYDGSSYAVVVILMTFYTRIDGVLLERLSSDGNEAGVYAFGFRLLDICNMVGYLFASLLLPMFARLLTQRDELRQLLTLATSLMAVFTLSAGAVVWALADDLARLMLDDYTPAAAMVLRWLFISLQAVGMIHIWGTSLTARGNLWGVNRVFAVAIVVNVGLNLYVIPHYGALGAAWVAIVTQCLVALAEGVLVMRWLQIRPRSMWLLRWGGFVLGLLGAVWCVTHLFSDWHLFVRLSALGAWCVVWSVICGTLPLIAMFNTLKHKAA